MLRIGPADDTEVVRMLIDEYGRSTGLDLEFQGFSNELATLASFYDVILLAQVDGAPAGCIALRNLGDGVCEMKRLYVRPAFRAQNVGRALAEQLIAEARGRGFTAMRLDTLPSMQHAITLYESLGFVDIDPYRYNPVHGTRFLELKLS
jgi:ribosomal protein S18 acetylase RimI-like enzyme